LTKRKHSKSKSKYQFHEVSSPFDDIKPDDLIRIVKSVGERHDTKFNEELRNLVTEILKYDPLLLLSYFSTFELAGPEGMDPEFTQADPILQHHVEILQALILQNKYESYKNDYIHEDEYLKVKEMLREIGNSFFLRKLSEIDLNITEEEKKREILTNQIQTQTTAVRNWGYPQHETEIVIKLFSKIEDKIEKQFGFKIVNIVKMCISIQRIVEDRINDLNDKKRHIHKISKLKFLLDYAEKNIQDGSEYYKELISKINNNNYSLKQSKNGLINYITLHNSKVYAFEIDKLIELYPDKIEKSVLIDVLNTWSYKFGDLSEFKTEYIFMGNPIWQKPIIKLEEELYFWPITTLFLSFCLELVESLIIKDESLYNIYKDRRSEFLEDELEYMFRESFPNSQVFKNSIGYDPKTDKNFENDLTIIVDSCIFIVEAKSGHVTDPAKRGAEHRLKREVDELIVEPSIQINRFLDYLKRNPVINEFESKQKIINKIDTSNIYEQIGLNITLESIGALQANWPDLREAGFIRNDEKIHPTMSLADLKVIFELLKSTSMKIHYLIRRCEFEQNADYLADEIDLVAFYLDNGFNIGNSEHDGTHLQLYGISQELNIYFMNIWRYGEAKLPSLKISKYWKDVLEMMESRHFTRWSEIAYMLLCFPYDSQIEFKKGFDKVISKVKKGDSHDSKIENRIILKNSNSSKTNIIMGIAYKTMSSQERKDLISYYSEKVINDENVDRILVIGNNVDDLRYPYGLITCVQKNIADNNL
jgi:hypothetical protein